MATSKVVASTTRRPTLAELPPPPPGKSGWPWTEASPQLADTMPDGSPWPCVSIVTPSYNQGQFVEETIRSVLQQGYPGLEYIIIDGGSTDNTVEIIRRYEPWLAHWSSERDRGQAHALNKGFGLASGELVGWLNSDDLYEPGAVAKAAKALVGNHEAVAVYGGAEIIDELGKSVGAMPSLQFDAGLLLLGNYVPQPSVFMRRSALAAVGPLDEELHYAMDQDLWFRLAAAGELMHLKSNLARFRLCRGTKSGAQPERFVEDTFRILDRLFEDTLFAERYAPQRDRAYARAFWERGICCLLKDSGIDGASHCGMALQLGMLASDTDFAVRMLVVDPTTLRCRPKQLVTRLLSALPLPDPQRAAFMRETWRHFWELSFYQAHSQGERARVLTAAFSLLSMERKWLRSRGFLSIFARAVLGARMVHFVRLAKG